MPDPSLALNRFSRESYNHVNHEMNEDIIYSLDNEWNLLRRKKRKGRDDVKRRNAETTHYLLRDVLGRGMYTCNPTVEVDEHERAPSIDWSYNVSATDHVVDHHPLWGFQKQCHRSNAQQEENKFLQRMPFSRTDFCDENNIAKEKKKLMRQKRQTKSLKKKRKKTEERLLSRSHRHHKRFSAYHPCYSPFPPVDMQETVVPPYHRATNENPRRTPHGVPFFPSFPVYPTAYPHHLMFPYPPCFSTLNYPFPSVPCAYPMVEGEEGGVFSLPYGIPQKARSSRSPEKMKKEADMYAFQSSSRAKNVRPILLQTSSTDLETKEWNGNNDNRKGAICNGLVIHRKGRKEDGKQEPKVISPSSAFSPSPCANDRRHQQTGTGTGLNFSPPRTPSMDAGEKDRVIPAAHAIPSPRYELTLVSSDSGFGKIPVSDNGPLCSSLPTPSLSSPSVSLLPPFGSDSLVREPHNRTTERARLADVLSPTPDLCTLHPTLVFLHTLQNEVEILSLENSRVSLSLCRNVFRKDLLRLQLKEQGLRYGVYEEESQKRWEVWGCHCLSVRSLIAEQRSSEEKTTEKVRSACRGSTPTPREAIQRSSSSKKHIPRDVRESPPKYTALSSSQQNILDTRPSFISPSSSPHPFPPSSCASLSLAPGVTSPETESMEMHLPCVDWPSPLQVGPPRVDPLTIAVKEELQKEVTPGNELTLPVLLSSPPSLYSSPSSRTCMAKIDQGCHPIPTDRADDGVQTEGCAVLSVSVGSPSSIFSTRDQGTSPLSFSIFPDSCLSLPPAVVLPPGEIEVQDIQVKKEVVFKYSLGTNTDESGFIGVHTRLNRGVDKGVEANPSSTSSSRGSSPIPSPSASVVRIGDAATSSVPTPFVKEASDAPSQQTAPSIALPPTSGPVHANLTDPLPLPPETEHPSSPDVPLLLSLPVLPVLPPPPLPSCVVSALSSSDPPPPLLYPPCSCIGFDSGLSAWTENIISHWIPYVIGEALSISVEKISQLLSEMERVNRTPKRKSSISPSPSLILPLETLPAVSEEKLKEEEDSTFEALPLRLVERETSCISFFKISHPVERSCSPIPSPAECVSLSLPMSPLEEANGHDGEGKETLRGEATNTVPSLKDSQSEQLTSAPPSWMKDERWISKSYQVCLSSLSPQPANLPERYKAVALPYLPPTAKPSVVALHRHHDTPSLVKMGVRVPALRDITLVTPRPAVVLLSVEENQREARKIGVQRAAYAAPSSQPTEVGSPTSQNAHFTQRTRHAVGTQPRTGIHAQSPRSGPHGHRKESSMQNRPAFSPSSGIVQSTRSGNALPQKGISATASPGSPSQPCSSMRDVQIPTQGKVQAVSSPMLVSPVPCHSEEKEKKVVSVHPPTSSSIAPSSSCRSLPTIVLDGNAAVVDASPKGGNPSMLVKIEAGNPPPAFPSSDSSPPLITRSSSIAFSLPLTTVISGNSPVISRHGPSIKKITLTSRDSSSSSFTSTVANAPPPSTFIKPELHETPSLPNSPLPNVATSISPSALASPAPTTPSSLKGSFSPLVEIRTFSLQKTRRKNTASSSSSSSSSSLPSSTRLAAKKTTIQRSKNEEDTSSSSSVLKKASLPRARKKGKVNHISKDRNARAGGDVALRSSALSSSSSSLSLSSVSLTSTTISRKNSKKQQNREDSRSLNSDGASREKSEEKVPIKKLERLSKSENEKNIMRSTSSSSPISSASSSVGAKRITRESAESSDVQLSSSTDMGEGSKHGRGGGVTALRDQPEKTTPKHANEIRLTAEIQPASKNGGRRSSFDDD